VYIQPQAREGEPYERYNWDAPILVSPHSPTRLYFASQRVWRSENRGDSWTPVSKDLTRDQDRITLPIMGKQQSWDNAWDVYAMSNYNTVTSLAESPKQEGLIYAGTDDGILQITENGGQTWRKLELGSIKGVPDRAFVNDVRADLNDANTVYLVLDNHKYGDYKPYILKSTNKGKSWSFINDDLPERLLIWRIVQDHVDKNLIFAATEFGVYVTRNGGKNWIKLNGGIPTISIRDITIQRRENDLVAASFGRGFYVLDDISPLRNFDPLSISEQAMLFEVKPAYWYIQKSGLYGQGDNNYKAKNPPYGAKFTYYLKDKLSSLKELRQKKEKKTKNTNFPGWDKLEAEKRQQGPNVVLIIKDEEGKVINTVVGTNKKGFNRANWKLDYPDKSGEKLNGKSPTGRRTLVTPGTYNVTLAKKIDGNLIELAGPKEFKVVPLKEGALKGKSYEEIESFREDYFAFSKELSGTNLKLSNCVKLVKAMQNALTKADEQNVELFRRVGDARTALLDIEKELSGDKTKGEIGQVSDDNANTYNARLASILRNSTYGPTEHHMNLLNMSKNRLAVVKNKLDRLYEDKIHPLKTDLKNAGAPLLDEF
ncbi:MAG: glycosyl hydrolase, partial [Bacteroidia bacterium]|nr:glycosyl hydrolase [Bacteroidia bacterium]